MFIRIIAGNAAFAALVWGWWIYVGGDRDRAVAGIVLAFAAFLGGLVTGLVLVSRSATPRDGRAGGRPAPPAGVPVDLDAFDKIA